MNAVIHRANIARAGEMVKLAVALGARRVEIAHTQYYGWGIINRAALMPTEAQATAAIAEVEALREATPGVIVIDHVIPDYHARYPKACMGGWAKRTLNVTPSGKGLPCHAAESIPGLEFWNVRERAGGHLVPFAGLQRLSRHGVDEGSPAAPASARRSITAAAVARPSPLPATRAAADPVCHLSPDHDKVAAIARHAAEEDATGEPDYVYRAVKAPLPAE